MYKGAKTTNFLLFFYLLLIFLFQHNFLLSFHLAAQRPKKKMSRLCKQFLESLSRKFLKSPIFKVILKISTLKGIMTKPHLVDNCRVYQKILKIINIFGRTFWIFLPSSNFIFIFLFFFFTKSDIVKNCSWTKKFLEQYIFFFQKV